jgi:hypothetical protein
MDSFKLFVEKWITPVTLSCIVGGIIWGVQINIGVINLTKSVAAQQIEYAEIKRVHHQYELSIARTAIIQEEMLRQLDAAQKAIALHEKESAKWKQRIIRNDEAIRRNGGE